MADVVLEPSGDRALNSTPFAVDTDKVPAPDASIRDPHVLLVEDSPVQARVEAARLTRHYGDPSAVVIAGTLGEAVQALERAEFSCVLLDLGLPDADGLEAVKSIRAAAPDVAIVVLSGQEDEMIALLAVREGAQDYIVKDTVKPDHIVRSITHAIERKHQESVLVHQALYDDLTGLANRTQLESRLKIAVARVKRHRETSAVLFLDLDGFKLINDERGHAVGDTVLVVVARRLERMARSDDMVARLGGDEFVVLCEDTDAEGAGRLVRRIRAALHDPIALADGTFVVVGTSIGIALAQSATATPEGLLKEADAAMYADKASRGAGRERIAAPN